MNESLAMGLEGEMLDSEPAERHTFVIKLWQEGEENSRNWRGRITHVASGESLHFIHLQDIQDFITGYVQESVHPNRLLARLSRWFS